MKKKVIKKALLASLPVMASYIAIGIGFGVLLSAAGFGPLWAAAMSGLIVSGALQYVMIDLMAGGAGLLTVAVTSLVMSVRHLFYGFSLLEKYRGTGLMKPWLIYALTDETFSLTVLPTGLEREEEKQYFLLVTTLDFLSWVLGSALGGLLGQVIPFSTEGVDFAMTALFLSVVVEQWLSTKEHRPALIGLGCSALCLLIFGAESFILPSMLCISLGLFMLKKRGVEL